MRPSHRIAGLIALGLTVSVVPRTIAAPPEGAKHWAFIPVRRPAPPDTTDPLWAQNPIDRFVRAKMQAEGIKPASDADRRILIRRLYLDLIGLPPTPDEVLLFLEDKSPEAVAKVVDDLLARPQYGERWARH
jgi:hypothetical protein